MPRRGKLTLVACDHCRRRKIKCDGARPVCGACTERSEPCTWASQPGVTRSAALKSEVSRLNTRNGSLLDLCWQLKHGSASDAWTLVEQIRSGQLMPEISRPSKSRRRGTFFASSNRSAKPDLPGVTLSRRKSDSDIPSQLPAASSAESASISPTFTTGTSSPSLPVPDLADEGVVAGGAQPHSSVLPGVVQGLEPTLPTSAREPSLSPQAARGVRLSDEESKVLQSLQANVDKIRVGLTMQRICISEIFYCHDSEDFDRLLATLDQLENALSPRSILCEACAVAAACGQYVCDMISPGLLDYWYEIAKKFFDDCIEASMIGAIRVSALLGLFNLNKATVAIAYFEFGLCLVATYLNLQKRNLTPVWETGMISVVRTQRSLTFCSGWLHATLGYVSSSHEQEALNPDIAPSRTNEHDLVHGIVARIAVLKAVTMRTLWRCSDVASLLIAIQGLRNQLREWYGGLPVEAQLIQLGTDAHSPVKTSIYYVHLLHLGAVMLIFRYCVAGLRSHEDRVRLADEQRQVVNETLGDGLLAAQHSARIVSLMRGASQNVRHCWVTIYQSYVSGLILVYQATQLRATGAPSEQWLPNFDLANSALDVLGFCKELDPVARPFVASLTTHCEALQSAFEGSGDTAEQKCESAFMTPPSYEYLFISHDMAAGQQGASSHLFDEVCNPFGHSDPSTTHYRSEEERHFPIIGTPERHRALSPSRHAVFRGPDKPRGPITPGISNMEDGYLVGSNEPNW